MRIAKEWVDYKILDASNKEKLEIWGNVKLLRPSPDIIWDYRDLRHVYKDVDAVYNRSDKGGGYWKNLRDVPERWTISYKSLKFNLKQMGFKHTGLFPEQAVNWDYIIDKINSEEREIKVLNLFGYTGGASIAALSAGASVVHVDASKGMNEWCKENVLLNNFEDRPIRYLTDDVLKFVKREIRRSNTYDIIIMDPPSYGKGSNGEIWHFEDNIKELIELTSELLSDDAILYMVNTYSAGFSGKVIENLMRMHIDKMGVFSSDEIGLEIENSDLVLPCGVTTIWESRNKENV